MAEPAHSLPPNSDETAKPRVGPGSPPVDKQFQPGQSGNPSGRPKGIARRAREIASGKDGDTQLDNGETVLLFLASVMASGQEKTRDRVDAAKILLERGWGKPPQFAPIEDDDPLDFSEALVNALAADLDVQLDEIGAKRREREEREAAAGRD